MAGSTPAGLGSGRDGDTDGDGDTVTGADEMGGDSGRNPTLQVARTSKPTNPTAKRFMVLQSMD